MTVRVDGFSPCTACGGKLLPLVLCDACGAAAVLRDTQELDRTVACPECGTFHAWQLICDACRTRFPGLGPTAPLPPATPADEEGASPRHNPPSRPLRRVKGEVDARALADLLRVLGLDASRAQAIVDRGYDTLWKIARVSEAALARIPEVGPAAARKVVAALQLVQYLPPKRTKEAIAQDEYACPLCGCVTSAFAPACLECGTAFDEEEMEEDVRESFADEGTAALLAFYEAREREEHDDWELAYARGLLFESLGRVDEAFASLERAASLAPDAKKVRVAQLRMQAQQLRKPEVAEKLRATAKTLLEDVAWEQEVAKLDQLISEAARECAQCGTAVPAEMALCPSCGARIERLGPATPPKRPEPSATPELDAVMDDLLVGQLEESLSAEELELTKAAVLDWLIMELEETMSPETQVLRPPSERRRESDVPEPGPEPSPLSESIGFVSRWMRGSRGLVSGVRPKPGPRGRGKVNGLVNGQGRVNGLVNGVGRTNGLVNGVGRVNGLATPVGRVNGLVTMGGRVNGLVTGRGRINGLAHGARFAPPVAKGFRMPYPSRRVRLAAVVSGIVVAVMIAGLLFVPVPGPTGPITVDGSFGDWASVPMFDAATVASDPNVSIDRYAALLDQDSLYVFASMSGQTLGDAVGYDAIYFLIDGDGDASTGYFFDGIGADAVLGVIGGGYRVEGARLYSFAPGSEVNWSQRQFAGSAQAAASALGLEAAVSTNDIDRFSPTAFRIGIHTDNFEGASSRSRAVLTPTGGSILAEIHPLVSLVGTTPTNLFEIQLRALGSVPISGWDVSNFSFTFTPGVTLSLSPESATLTQGRPSATLVASVSAPGFFPGDAVEIDVAGASASIPLAVFGGPVRAYVMAPGSAIQIDGLFADWIGKDLTDSDPSPVQNPDVNMLRYGSSREASSANFHIAVAGGLLDGRIPERTVRSVQEPGSNGTSRPVPLPRLTGEDILRVYVDLNSSDSLGDSIAGIHADYFLEVRGHGGHIRSHALYSWAGTWSEVANAGVKLAKNATDFEGSLPVPATSETRMVFAATEWSGSGDVSPIAQALAPTPKSPAPSSMDEWRMTDDPPEAGTSGTRRANQPITLDVSGNGVFWFRHTDHATETLCTYDKVATSMKGSGPTETIILNPDESACWYIDETAGQTIPAGDWETRLDISLNGAEYDVRFQVWNKDSDAIDEPIGSCNDVTAEGNDVQCLVPGVLEKVLASNQVVRIEIAHSSLSGTVSIEYENSDTPGDSRTTLPIPEFGDIAIPVFAVVAVVLVVGLRRRK